MHLFKGLLSLSLGRYEHHYRTLVCFLSLFCALSSFVRFCPAFVEPLSTGCLFSSSLFSLTLISVTYHPSLVLHRQPFHPRNCYYSYTIPHYEAKKLANTGVFVPPTETSRRPANGNRGVVDWDTYRDRFYLTG